MYLRNLSVFLSILILSAFNALSQGVNLPQEQELLIAGISVSGNEFADTETIISLSGLRVNTKIKLINDFSVQRAVQNLWKRKQFSSVNISIDKVTSAGVFIDIQVKEFPRLNEIIVKNNNKLDNFEIIKGVGKIRGDIISNNDIQKSKESIR
jgi:outer membrane protein insertion porin family